MKNQMKNKIRTIVIIGTLVLRDPLIFCMK